MDKQEDAATWRHEFDGELWWFTGPELNEHYSYEFAIPKGCVLDRAPGWVRHIHRKNWCTQAITSALILEMAKAVWAERSLADN